jgi:beta-glucosidase
MRKLQGKRSGIPKADTTSLPQFLRWKESYINRSAELSENMFRFSLDFARLCPMIGHFDEDLMAEYIRTVALIRARGQEPFLTLYHFTLPKYLIRFDREGNIVAGGWECRDVTQRGQGSRRATKAQTHQGR